MVPPLFPRDCKLHSRYSQSAYAAARMFLRLHGSHLSVPSICAIIIQTSLWRRLFSAPLGRADSASLTVAHDCPARAPHGLRFVGLVTAARD